MIILNLVVRLKWLQDLIGELFDYADTIQVLKPVGTSFKAAVKIWKQQLNDYKEHAGSGDLATYKRVLIKHCAHKHASYVGFKYIKAVRYAIVRQIAAEEKYIKAVRYATLDKSLLKKNKKNI